MTTEKQVPPCLLAHKWETDIDPTGWWMSEKLDGVRAWWDGEVFRTRQGNTFDAPAWFTKDLPLFALDGELFGGRGMFQTTVGIVKKKDMAPEFSDRWKTLTYCVFDSPSTPGPFEARQERLYTLDLGIHARVLDQELCQGFDHLAKALKRMNAKGGEGLMLRQPGSLYEDGRSHTLLKVKSFYDAEAVVTAHVVGKGKHSKRLGAVEVMTPDGRKFSVGSGFTDEERENPPKIGATITYRYQELSAATKGTAGGIPRFPTFVCVRDYE